MSMKEETMSMSVLILMQKLPNKAIALVVGAVPTVISALSSLKKFGTVMCVDASYLFGGYL